MYGFNPWVGKIPRRRKWQPTPVLLSGKSHGQRNLVGYSPKGRKALDTTGRLSTYTYNSQFFPHLSPSLCSPCEKEGLIQTIQYKSIASNISIVKGMKAGNFDVELGRIKNQCLELINPQKMHSEPLRVNIFFLILLYLNLLSPKNKNFDFSALFPFFFFLAFQSYCLLQFFF